MPVIPTVHRNFQADPPNHYEFYELVNVCSEPVQVTETWNIDIGNSMFAHVRSFMFARTLVKLHNRENKILARDSGVEFLTCASAILLSVSILTTFCIVPSFCLKFSKSTSKKNLSSYMLC